MDARDMAVSRKLPELLKKIDELVTQELGQSHLIGLVVQRWGTNVVELAEFHYISNAPRGFMHQAFKALVTKWDSGGPDIQPHKKQ